MHLLSTTIVQSPSLETSGLGPSLFRLIRRTVEGSNRTRPRQTCLGRQRVSQTQARRILLRSTSLQFSMDRGTVRRAVGRLSGRQRSCTKHGPYEGAYCPTCYEKAVGSGTDEQSEARHHNE